MLKVFSVIILTDIHIKNFRVGGARWQILSTDEILYMWKIFQLNVFN
jgi:hypothetical protein